MGVFDSCDKLRDGRLGPLGYVALLYNLAQFAGWAYCGALMDGAVRWNMSVEGLAENTFPAAGDMVTKMQYLSMIEPVLCLIRVIPLKNLPAVIMQLVVRNVVILLTVAQFSLFSPIGFSQTTCLW